MKNIKISKLFKFGKTNPKENIHVRQYDDFIFSLPSEERAQAVCNTVKGWDMEVTGGLPLTKHQGNLRKCK